MFNEDSRRGGPIQTFLRSRVWTPASCAPTWWWTFREAALQDSRVPCLNLQALIRMCPHGPVPGAPPSCLWGAKVTSSPQFSHNASVLHITPFDSLVAQVTLNFLLLAAKMPNHTLPKASDPGAESNLRSESQTGHYYRLNRVF
jgi:hypothetical protein